MKSYMSASEWRRVAAPAVVVLLVACTNPISQSRMNTQNNLGQLRVAGQRASECRAAAARNLHCQVLREHMPLSDFEAVTLSQMTDKRFATKEEISALNSWINDINACLEPRLQESDATIPSIGPIIEASWNDNNTVFVKLADNQMRWGDAVAHLRSDRIKLRSDIIARADRVSEELGRLELAQFNRRTAVITSVIGILP